MIRKRTKAFSALFVTLAATVLLSMSMSVAYATTPISVSGTFNVTGGTVQSWSVSGESDNGILISTVSGVYAGDIAGAYISDYHAVVHNRGTPEMWRNIHTVATISATVLGEKTGTLYVMINGKYGEDGTWVIIGGTDDLAGLHGQGTYHPVTTTLVNYEGQIHFDP